MKDCKYFRLLVQINNKIFMILLFLYVSENGKIKIIKIAPGVQASKIWHLEKKSI